MKRVLLAGLLFLLGVIPAASPVAQSPVAVDTAVGKIVASTLGASPLEENLRRLTDESSFGFWEDWAQGRRGRQR